MSTKTLPMNAVFLPDFRIYFSGIEYILNYNLSKLFYGDHREKKPCVYAVFLFYFFLMSDLRRCCVRFRFGAVVYRYRNRVDDTSLREKRRFCNADGEHDENHDGAYRPRKRRS